MADALYRVYPESTDLHFILGFDTFERVLDKEGKYFRQYHRKFAERRDALLYLMERSRLIVAGRRDSGAQEYLGLIDREREWLRSRTAYMDLADDVKEISASEIRRRISRGESIEGLVPKPVERLIKERSLYT
jgi:nicotinic acid mononucleotide adenylyltransferase